MAPFDMLKFPQLIRDELDKRVQDLTSTVTFSLDVLEDMVPELVPYYKSAGENLFSIPRGCTFISEFVVLTFRVCSLVVVPTYFSTKLN